MNETIKLRSRFELAAREHRYYTGLSCAAYLVTLGHDPLDVVTKDGRITVFFLRTPELLSDADRYKRSTETLLARSKTITT